MEKLFKTFYEVEHQEDVQQIKDIIENNGGTIINSRFEYDEETFDVEIEVPDKGIFLKGVKDEYWFGQ